MPVLTSPDFANKFKEKWLVVYPEDQHTGTDSALTDDSLTSLHWLQNFSILSTDPERPTGAGPGCPSTQQHFYLKRLGFPGSDSPSSPPAADTAATGMPRYLGSPVTSGSDSNAAPHFASCAHPGSGYSQITIQPSPPEEVDYKNNPKVKPPYSYASLICMAMQASKQPKVTLSTIYNWITENFCYYRHAEPSWQVTDTFSSIIDESDKKRRASSRSQCHHQTLIFTQQDREQDLSVSVCEHMRCRVNVKPFRHRRRVQFRPLMISMTSVVLIGGMQ